MGTAYLLDSNVVIDFLDNKLPPAGMDFVSAMMDAIPHMSVISKIEILRFNASVETMKILADFIDCSVIHPLDDPVVDATISLCRQRKIKLPDAIIAATAMLNGFTVLTRNIADFKNVAGLRIQNPWD
jgi:predicted nucleic acid-binding protein